MLHASFGWLVSKTFKMEELVGVEEHKANLWEAE